MKKFAYSNRRKTCNLALTEASATIGTGNDEIGQVSATEEEEPGIRREREQREREQNEEGAHATAEGLLFLLKELWASGCLEACVHVLGETPAPKRYDIVVIH